MFQEFKNVLNNRGGEDIILYYEEHKMLTNALRRTLVNIVVDILIKRHGYKAPQAAKCEYAALIVKLFPHLRDNSGKYGYVSLVL